MQTKHSLARREFVTAGMAAMALAQTRPARSASAAGQRVRHDVASAEGRRMLAVYADGVKIMKSMPPGSPISWTFQWYIHFVGGKTKDAAIAEIFGGQSSPQKMLAQETWNTCQAHLGGTDNQRSFFPWHRMYVYELERIVRKLTATPEFTLPYWNYSDPATRVLPAEFRNPASPLYSASRKPPVNGGAAIPADLVKLTALMEMEYASNGVAPGVNTAVDRGIHGNVHTWVGDDRGMGSVPWAANDPIFWLHHCNIDRLWASWNHAGGVNPTDAAWTDRVFLFADENAMQAALRNGDVTSTAQLGYTYDKFEPMAAVAPAARAGRVPALAASDAGRVVMLAGDPVTVRLAAAPGADWRGATAAGARLYLVIDDVHANREPGVVFRVYLNPGAAPGGAAGRSEIGVLNFFEASHQMPGMEHNKGGVRVSFLVETAGGMTGGDPVVTIIPDGPPLAGSNPRVGQIRLEKSP